MTPDDQQLLSAYLDGELSADKLSEVQNRLLIEPELQHHLNKLKKNDTAIKNTFDEITKDPVPESIQALLRPESRKVSSASSSKIGRILQNNHAFRYWPSAIAASFIVVINIFISQHYGNSDSLLEIDAAQPSEQLAHILSKNPSGSIITIDEHKVHTELSFLRADDTFCRQYAVYNSDAGLRAVSCYEKSTWINKVVSKANLKNSGTDTYQPASAEESKIIDDYIEANMQGVPLTQAEEKAELQDR